MDDRQGGFVMADDQSEFKKLFADKIEKLTERIEAMDGVFKIGETLSVRGSRFVVYDLHEDGTLVLKLVPRRDWPQEITSHCVNELDIRLYQSPTQEG